MVVTSPDYRKSCLWISEKISSLEKTYFQIDVKNILHFYLNMNADIELVQVISYQMMADLGSPDCPGKKSDS